MNPCTPDARTVYAFYRVLRRHLNHAAARKVVADLYAEVHDPAVRRLIQDLYILSQ